MTRKRITTKTYIIGILISAIIGLAVYNMRDFLFGTPLHIVALKDGTTIHSLVLPINGNALHAKTITVNGRPIAIDPKGTFNDEVLLSPGYNVVEISLFDRFGKEKTKTLHLVAVDDATAHSIARSGTSLYQE